MTEGLVIPIPVFIDVKDVMTSMKCSRTTAYAHMRQAIGRRPGERGQLRVPIYVWQRYVDAMFDPGARRPEPQRPTTPSPLRITRPRSRKKPRR